MEEFCLESIVLKDADLQDTYYKMLKGTKYYDFEKKMGTPSLLHFVKFENSKLKIPIINASYELLISTFNKSIADEIQVLQKQNPPKNLTKTAVLDICQKRHFRLNENILDFFDFSNRLNLSKERIFVGIDKKTQIKVTRKVAL